MVTRKKDIPPQLKKFIVFKNKIRKQPKYRKLCNTAKNSEICLSKVAGRLWRAEHKNKKRKKKTSKRKK